MVADFMALAGDFTDDIIIVVCGEKAEIISAADV